MSLLEFGREVEAFNEARQEHIDREEREMQREVALAWRTAAFYGELQATGKLPSLADVLARMKAKPDATPQKPVDILSQLSVLSKQYGVPMRPMSQETFAAMKRPSAHG